MSKWKSVKLGDVCVVERGGSPRPIEKFITDDINGVNWIKIGDASSDSMYISNTKQKIIPEGMKKSRYVQSGDFLLSNSMSFGRPYILKIDGCIHDGWLVLKDKKNFFHKEYLYYALSSKTTYEKFKSLAVGGVVNNLNSTIVKQVEFPLPPMETQKQIAKTLDTAVELLTLRKQQLAELDNLIKSTFYDMFGEFENIETKPLIDLIDEGAGLSYGIVQPGDDVGKGIGVVRPVDIIQGKLSLDNIKYIPANIEAPFKKTRLTGNEILITVRGTTGDTVLTDERCVGMNVTRGIAVIRQNDKFANKFYLSEYLKSESSQRYIQDNTRGATLKQINLSVLRELPIPLPSLEHQNYFSSIINKIEEQKALVKKTIDETQYLLDSLTAEYFE